MENYIIVTQTGENRIQELVSGLAESYSDTGTVDEIDILQHRTRPDSYRLLFPGKPDFEQFCYFVNYLKYPIDQVHDQIEVYGYWDLQASNPRRLTGRRAMLYIAPPQETSPDCVYAGTDQGMGYKLDFGGDTLPLPSPAENFHETLNENDWKEFITIGTEKRLKESEIPNKGCLGIIALWISLGSALFGILLL